MVFLLMEVYKTMYFLLILDFKGGYRFGGNPEEIFEKFFGTNNPFASLIGILAKFYSSE